MNLIPAESMYGLVPYSLHYYPGVARQDRSVIIAQLLALSMVDIKVSLPESTWKDAFTSSDKNRILLSLD